jgi:prepilin-type N-terminal cleavage/methylation domain-containing protein
MWRFHSKKNGWKSDKGFTLIEVIVVVAILGILAGFATPSFMEMIQNSRYREATRNLVSAFREARSLAVNTNLPHRVEIDAGNSRVRLFEGDSQVREWVVAPSINLDPVVAIFTFNPNGSVAQDGDISVSVLDHADVVRFEVRVAQSGRIRIL